MKNIWTQSSFKSFAKESTQPIFVSARQLSRKCRKSICDNTDKTIAVNTMCRALRERPWHFICCNRYNRWFATICSTCTEVEKVAVICIPWNLVTVSCSMKGRGWGVMEFRAEGRDSLVGLNKVRTNALFWLCSANDSCSSVGKKWPNRLSYILFEWLWSVSIE